MNKFISDVKQLNMKKIISDVKQLKMNKFIKSIWKLIFNTSNATLKVASLRSCPPFNLAKKRISLSTHLREYPWALIWKKSFLICFKSCHDIPYSYRQSRKRMVNTLLMVNITPLSYARKKIQTWFASSASR